MNPSRLRHVRTAWSRAHLAIVEGCTDSFEEDSSKKLEWEVRKKSYIDRLRKEQEGTLLVSAADKLYNARAILEDYREIGAEVWSRFKRAEGAALVFRRTLKSLRGERLQSADPRNHASHRRTRATFGRRWLENPEHDLLFSAPGAFAGIVSRPHNGDKNQHDNRIR